jgi:predicted metal-binding membrane protein
MLSQRVNGVFASPFERSRLALIGALLALAAVGWALTGDRMAGMDGGPGTNLGSLGFYVTAWVVMMGAMMFPSIAPMVIVYNRVHVRRRDRGGFAPAGATAVFVAGYLISWTAFGLFAYALFAFVKSLSIDSFSWDEGGKYLAGGVVLAAAVYQLTPLKDVCLSKCRSPLSFLMGSWNDGYGGALQMGISHGGWCIGCCWALMAALFALGVMSVGWMVFVAALIATEKMLPWKAVANRSIALLLVVLGLAVAFAPERVPGLTIPGSMDMGGSTQMGRSTQKTGSNDMDRSMQKGGPNEMDR